MPLGVFDDYTLEHFVFNLTQIKSFHFLQIMIRYIYIMGLA